MPTMSLTWLYNQRPSDLFWADVERDIELAGRRHDGVDRDILASMVMACWLNYAVPAGNA